ncbi:hypothetical protein L195_g041404, partial [Trifolium pratense]
MTFQMALNPPGGVRPAKDDGDNNADDIACSNQSNVTLAVCPGEAVLAVIFSDQYKDFLRWNTICFIASLSVLHVLVSGISLNH